MLRKCCVGGCNATSDTHRLFSFPKNEYYRKLWLSFLEPTNTHLTGLTKDQLLKKRVCHKHFDRYQMDGHGGRIRCSYPCLFSEKEIAHGIPLSSEEYSALSEHNYHKQCGDDNTETSSNFANADDCFNEHSTYKMPVFVDINSVTDTWSMEEVTALTDTQRPSSASQHIRPEPKAMIIRPMNRIEKNPIETDLKEETMADETGAMMDVGWDGEELILDNRLDTSEDNSMPVKYSPTGGLPEDSDVPLVESSKDDSMPVAVNVPSTLRKEKEKRRRVEDAYENSSKVRLADLARKKIRSGLYARPANSQLKVLILAKAGVRMQDVSRKQLVGWSENISKPIPSKDPLDSKKMIMSKRRRFGGAVENPSKSYAYTMALSRKLRLESYARKVKTQLKLLMLDKSGVRMREVPGSPSVSSSENNSMHIPAQNPPVFKKNLKDTRRRVDGTDEILSQAHGVDLARKKLRLGSNVRVAKLHLKVLILDKSGVQMDQAQALIMRKKLEECHMQGYLQNRDMVAPAFTDIQFDRGGLRVEACDDYSLAWLSSFVESLPSLWNGSWGYKVVSLAKKTCKAPRYMTGKMFLSDFPYRKAEMLRDFLAYCNSKYRVLTWPIFAHEYSDDIETKQTNHVLTLGIPTLEAIEINRNGNCLFFKLMPVPIEIKNLGHPAIEINPQIPSW